MTDADGSEHPTSGPPSHDPTEPLDATNPLPSPGPSPSSTERVIDLDRVDQADVVRFMARRLLIWAVPLVLIGVLLVALGLPVWVIVIALVASLAIVLFEIDL